MQLNVLLNALALNCANYGDDLTDITFFSNFLSFLYLIDFPTKDFDHHLIEFFQPPGRWDAAGPVFNVKRAKTSTISEEVEGSGSNMHFLVDFYQSGSNTEHKSKWLATNIVMIFPDNADISKPGLIM